MACKINDLLTSKKDSRIIIRELYRLQKKQNVRFSLQHICDHVGIPSKGYLSDIMALKRPLNPKYVPGFAKIFGLNRKQERVLELRTQYGKELDAKRKTQILQEISTVLKTLEVKTADAGEVRFKPIVFSKVFCSFGLIGEFATAKQIAVAVREPIQDVFQALDALIQWGLVRRRSELYELTHQQIVFNEKQSLTFQKELIRSYAAHTDQHLNHWLARPDDSYIESSTISVKYENYKNLLKRIKQVFDEFQSELESTKADRLIHFNVQIFPDKS